MKKRLTLILTTLLLTAVAVFVYADGMNLHWDGWNSATGRNITSQPSLGNSVDLPLGGDHYDSNSFQDTWYFNGFFDNGSKYIAFRLTFTGRGDNIDFTFWNANGADVYVKKSIDEGDNRGGLSGSSLNVSLEDCSVRKTGDNTYVIHIDVDDGAGNSASGDLTLTRTSPRWRPGNGSMYLDDDHDDYLRQYIIVPDGTCTGNITVNGTRHSNISGRGYMEHGFSSTWVFDYMEKVFAGRNFSGDYLVRYMYGCVTDDYNQLHSRYRYIMFIKDGEIVWEGDDFNWQETGSTVSGVDRTFKDSVRIWKTSGNFRFDLTLTKTAMMEELDVLAALSRIQRVFAQMFSEPMIYRMKANMTGIIIDGSSRARINDVSLAEISFTQDD